MGIYLVIIFFAWTHNSYSETVNGQQKQWRDCYDKCDKRGQIGFMTINNQTCINYGNTTQNSTHINGHKTTFCEINKKSKRWCATKKYYYVKDYDWDYCKIEDCRRMRTDRHCLTLIEGRSSSSSLSFRLSYLSNESSIIVVLYSEDNECYLRSVWNGNGSEIDIFIRTFFPFCTILSNNDHRNDSITLSPVPDNSKYIIYIIPINNSTNIGRVTRMNMSTTTREELKSEHIKLVWRNSSSIELTTSYLNDFVPGNTEGYKIAFGGPSWIGMTNEKNTLFYKLNPCTEYNFKMILSDNQHVEIESTNQMFYTTPDVVKINPLLGYEQTISWSYNNTNNCPIIFEGEYFVQSSNESVIYFSTSVTKTNIIGLTADIIYMVRVRACMKIKDNCTIYGEYSEWRKGQSVNYLSLAAVVSVVIILSVILFIMRRHLHTLLSTTRRYRTRTQPTEETTTKIKNDPVPIMEEVSMASTSEIPLSTRHSIENFATYYKHVCRDGNKLIKVEYKKLCDRAKCYQQSENLSSKHGEMPRNSCKNRFTNILPYDHNRVILKGRSKDDDYINASYIPFDNNADKVEYIASQGPIVTNVSDFWKMIWDENVTCIVMLTECMEEEQFKCVQYWPDEEQAISVFGTNSELNVQLLQEDITESFTQRKLEIYNKSLEERKIIIHLHMRTWFDFSAPSLETFEIFLFRFHELCNNTVHSPYLIHCSAGVGRTGTFTVIDRIIKKLVDRHEYVDIFNEVLILRKYRNLMVQRQAQYIFIFEFLNYFLKKYVQCGKLKEMNIYNND